MVQMIMDQNLFSCTDSPLHSMQLLRNISASTSIGHHADNILKMPISTFEPLYDIRISLMSMISVHRRILPGG